MEELDELFIFEMANNHQGDLIHGKKIIEQLDQTIGSLSLNACIKFQLRDFDTFIAPEYKNRMDVKLVKRLSDTRLSPSETKELVEYARSFGFKVMATVFDETSMGLFEQLDFDYLKIASCSAKDWPLLSELSKIKKPTVLSTAGCTEQDIQRSIECLKKGPQELSIMHCVGIYPTPDSSLGLSRIKTLASFFPAYRIGYSTHESPDNTQAVAMAYALGARLFEKHVDTLSVGYQMNRYSATPDQVLAWVESFIRAKQMMAPLSFQAREQEEQQLRLLKRAVYVNTNKSAGDWAYRNELMFAIPSTAAGLLTEDLMQMPLKLKKDCPVGAPVKKQEFCTEAVMSQNNSSEFIRRGLSVLREAQMALPSDCEIELSCHYGLERFEQFGSVIFTLLNEDYCKKFLVLFAGQSHPEHRHLERQESLSLVHGSVTIGHCAGVYGMKKGEYIHIEKNDWHEFTAHQDSVIEEISTHYEVSTSDYRDESINARGTELRKIKGQLKAGRIVWAKQVHHDIGLSN
jgi:N-acetylneuraminate synthase